MRIPRIVVVSLLIVGLSAPARAGDLRTSVEQAAQETARRPDNKPIPKTYLWLGSSLFVGGMAVGLFAFMHDKNGQFPGTDEYNATDRKLGAAGLFTAFGGGMLLFIGKRQANRSPVVIFDSGRISVSKQVSW
jgi:hypothetical protein